MKKLLLLLFLVPNLVMGDTYSSCTKLANMLNTQEGKDFFSQSTNNKMGLKQIACEKNPTKVIAEYIILEDRLNNLTSNEERQFKFIANKTFTPFFCKSFLNTKMSVAAINEVLKSYFEIRLFKNNAEILTKNSMSFADCPF
jgi:hypothetical protein